jgi:hypothetical protein
MATFWVHALCHRLNHQNDSVEAGTLTAALSHCSSAGIGGAFECVPGSLNRQLSVESSSTD